jgi:riboflavin kinase/FMN adenylyltransferase
MGRELFSGIVQKGEERGAALGFPTVNIPLHDNSVSGVYAAKVKVGEEEYEAAAYADRKRNVLEAHLLDFSADLYGWNVTIELLKKIREHKKFASDESLRKTIAGDIAAARRYFTRA